MDESKDGLTIHFIISSPRSGTHWLNHALNQHPDIFATENRLFGDFNDLWPSKDGQLLPRMTVDRFVKVFSGHFDFEALGMNRNRFLRTFQRGFQNFLMRYALQHSGKKVMIDKITPYHDTCTTVLESIEMYFPRARLVQLLRDGRDVATSGGFDWLLRDAQGTDRYSYFVERRPGMRLRRFFDDELLRFWAKYWMQPLVALESCPFHLIVVRYEEMKRDQADVILRICEHLHIACTQEQAEYCAHEASFEKTTGRQPGETDHFAKSRKGTVGDWRNFFTQQDGKLFQELTDNWLVRSGYESESNWYESLPESLDLGPLS
jgi:hypothetical protein